MKPHLRRIRYNVAVKRVAGFIAVHAVFSLLAIGCSSTQPTGNLQKIGNMVDREQLQKLYKELQVPLVLVGNDIFLPPKECLCDEQRNYGAGEEQRSLGGGEEQRHLGGSKEERRIAGEGEKRELSGSGEKRTLGGDVERRKTGGEDETRRIGVIGESRQVSGGAEQRAQAGATERRIHGGEGEGLQCVKLPDCEGFEILNGSRLDIRIFDGVTIRVISGGIVHLR
ncbi:MAG TPA: hypothetical protein VNL36_11045 [Bacteroidota bacterium]|nr:hypothetical protein [Bacteroidota bacterium]